MRRRLIAALVGVAVVTLLLYATPRAIAVDGLLRQQEQTSLERSADLVTAQVERHLADGDAIDDALARGLAVEGQQLVIELPDGTTARSGPPPNGSTVGVTRAQPDGTRTILRAPTASVDERIADAFTSRLVTGAVVLAFAVVLAIALARHLARPFTELADFTDRRKTGADPAPRSGIPEADQLADALDRSQARVAETLRREREFSANASHQLRTPITALRLRLEDLGLWPEVSDAVRAELDAALAETDRLADTVTELLELARSGDISNHAPVDLVDLTTEAARRLGDRFQQAGRTLSIESSGGSAVVTTSPGAVRQIVDVLVCNALDHGRGTVLVSVTAEDDATTIRVQDEGHLTELDAATIFDRSVRSSTSTGSGIGLALARTIARSIRARLDVQDTGPTTFELRVPREPAAGPLDV